MDGNVLILGCFGWDCLLIVMIDIPSILTFPSLSGDQLAIAKETGRRLGMGTNMYPSSALLGQNKDESIVALPVDELIEKADGFAGVFPGRKLDPLIYTVHSAKYCWIVKLVSISFI